MIRFYKLYLCLALFVPCAAPFRAIAASVGASAAFPQMLPDVVAARWPDRVQLPEPWQIQLEGYLGQRVVSSERNRLLAVDEDDLLDAFERREVPHQDWQGEHVGKFLHAATLAWRYTGDAALKAKLDRVVARLLKTQEDDGYLGTYAPAQRWTSWDVWVHKYDLIGLLTYARYTGNRPALQSCRRIGDLLVATFPAKKSIIAAGMHVGMASTSVLEPMVLLYRATGDPKYLAFARYIVRAWDEPNGPHLLSALQSGQRVDQTANGKSYEMLSNLVGLCELARATGDKTLLPPVVNAWRDIVAHQLYITGTTSHGEHFGAPNELPNAAGANVGETCVTVTWIQLNAQLLRLTGEARYGDELERSFYNHLAAAQSTDGALWCYYTPLEGTKPLSNRTSCCLSSGPRGMALLPLLATCKYLQDDKNQGVAVNIFETSRTQLMLNGQSVTIEQHSDFPRAGHSTWTLKLSKPAVFGFKVRAPQWAQPMHLRKIGTQQNGKLKAQLQNGWLGLAPQRWQNGDRIALDFQIQAHQIAGDHSNAGRDALLWGPLVLAFETDLNPTLPTFRGVAIAPKAPITLLPAAAQSSNATAPLIFKTSLFTANAATPRTATMIPFATSGNHGSFAIWLWTPQALPHSGIVGKPSRSRTGNVLGDIGDGDNATYVVTFDNSKSDTDWYALTFNAPVTVRRVVFAHGHSFADGGWFDSSTAFGKPQLQIQSAPGGAWQTVGTFDAYPATTSVSDAGLQDGQMFSLLLPRSQTLSALRIIGVAASGDAPQQAFSSCAELQAWAQ